MRSVRERPRLMAVRVLGAALLLGIGVAIGALADNRSAEVQAQTQAELNRIERVSDKRADQLDRTDWRLTRLRVELDDTIERSRSLAQANSRVRNELRRTQRALRRMQRLRRPR
jgi:septal ring factor EnvC (AmiA/AmiB activator)